MGRSEDKQSPDPEYSYPVAEIYQALFKQASDSLFVVDDAGSFLDVNNAACQMIGYSREALATLCLADLFSGSDFPKRPFPPSFRAILHNKDGRTVPVDIETRPLGNDTLFVVHTAVTHPLTTTTPDQAHSLNAQHDEQALQTQLVQIAATVPGMICSFKLRADGSTCMPYTSPALYEIYGLDAAQLAQTAAPLFAIIHPQDLPHVEKTIAESARNMTVWHAEYRVQHPRRGEIWIEGRSMPQRQDDGSILWHGFIQDISERKRTEQAVNLMVGLQKQIALLSNLEDIYRFVGEKIQELVDDCYTGASIFDEKLQAMRIIGLYGLGRRYNNLVHRSKFDPYNIIYPLADMTPEEIRTYRSGHLETFEGGLYAVLARKIPKKLCEAVEKQLKITTIYTMGFVWDNQHFGGLTILAKKDISPYRELIETIMNQAAIVIKRVKAEDALRDSEEKMRLFIEHAPASLAMFDTDMRYLFVSNRWVSDYSLATRNIIGQSHYDIFPEITEQWKLAHRRGMAGEVIRNNEDKFLRADGTVQWLRWEVRPWYDTNGVIGGIVIFSEDITERKQTRQELDNLQGILTAAEKVAGIGSWKWDLKTQKVVWSDEMFRLFGVDRENFDGDVNRVINSRIHPDDIETVNQSNRNVLEDYKPTPTEYRIVLPDGTQRTVWAEGQLMNDQDGRPVSLVGYVQDITKRKEAEAIIDRLNRRMELILNSAGEGIYGTDINGRITFINPAMATMLGWEPANLIGQNAHHKFHHTLPNGRAYPAAECTIHRAMLNGQTYHSDDDIYWHKDGSPLAVEFTSTPIWEEGQIAGTVIVARDITERKQAAEEQARLEEQLRQSQKMEGIGRLAGGIAHDFNNQLTIIQIYCELMRNQMSDTDPLLPKLEQIYQASQHAVGLTTQLLAFSRKQLLQPVSLNLNSLIGNLKSMLSRMIGEDITLNTVLQPEVWPVKADPGQIEQVIMNLTVNARDAMPTGGILTMETSNQIFDGSIKGAHLDAPLGPCVMMAITDTGHGMDAATKKQIFEPFFTTKQPGKGTGLGLSTVHGIIKQSGGAIFVYSELEKGTTFKIYLPADVGVINKPTQPSPVVPLSRGNETILLVEDEDAVRNLVHLTLDEMGYTVLEANDPNLAIDLVETSQTPIDLLLTDVVMPHMSGRELAETLTPRYPKMKVLYMSGYLDDAVMRHGLLTAQVEFLPKPFTRSTLVAKVREVLDK